MPIFFLITEDIFEKRNNLHLYRHLSDRKLTDCSIIIEMIFAFIIDRLLISFLRR
uniref:Uncharacterized protein n=1 Tax=Siphoviridae sp. ctgN495 TaxID=2825608 RepID=A0A8S5UCS8_9CAUD|nr:MAG TPA: hypothetical protein [Siphoviridae sp. ctgN495]